MQLNAFHITSKTRGLKFPNSWVFSQKVHIEQLIFLFKNNNI